MMYEIHITKIDGTATKEAFTAVNDKKAILRIASTLQRHAHSLANRSYRLIDANRREVVRETQIIANPA